MEKFVIQGGVPLSGEITAAGNKNAALPILAACLLTEEELVIANVPRIRDTEAQIALLADLGVETEWVEDNTIRLCAKNVKDTTLDEDLSAAIRASFLMAGPLLARFGKAKALSVLAHKLGRAIFHMQKRQQPFDAERFYREA